MATGILSNAGGCLLTELSFVSKVRDVFDHADDLNLRDFRLLRIARHFRIGPRTKVLIGRNEAENEVLEGAVHSEDAALRWLEGSSPLGVVMGKMDDSHLETAAKILLRYTKAEAGQECAVKVLMDGNERLLKVVNDFSEARIEDFRV